MASNDKKNTDIPTQPEINPDTYLGTQYSQVVSVTVTDLDSTFEFVYVNPQTKKGIVVSRVTMAAVAAEDFAKLVLKAFETHRGKKSKEN